MVVVSNIRVQAQSLRTIMAWLLLFSVMYTVSLIHRLYLHKAQQSSSVNEPTLNDIGMFFNQNSSHTCKNSVQGKHLICDSRGYVCSRRNMDRYSCCRMASKEEGEEGQKKINQRKINNHSGQSDIDYIGDPPSEQFDCSGCIFDNGCCREYEYCISCCLKPQNLQKHFHLYLSIPILQRNAPDSGYDTGHLDYFDYCRHVCRSSSLSVQSENSYRGFHNHCYSLKLSPIERIPVNSDWTGFLIVKSKT